MPSHRFTVQPNGVRLGSFNDPTKSLAKHAHRAHIHSGGSKTVVRAADLRCAKSATMAASSLRHFPRNPCHPCQCVSFVQRHDAHALSVAADLADVGGADALNLAAR